MRVPFIVMALCLVGALVGCKADSYSDGVLVWPGGNAGAPDPSQLPGDVATVTVLEVIRTGNSTVAARIEIRASLTLGGQDLRGQGEPFIYVDAPQYGASGWLSDIRGTEEAGTGFASFVVTIPFEKVLFEDYVAGTRELLRWFNRTLSFSHGVIDQVTGERTWAWIGGTVLFGPNDNPWPEENPGDHSGIQFHIRLDGTASTGPYHGPNPSHP